MNGAGESKSPFSQFVNVESLQEILTDAPKSASPTTVTNIIVLPSQTNKKALKSYLREKLFPADHDIRSVLYKRLVKRIECNEQMFSRTMYEQFIEENFSTDEEQLTNPPLPGFIGKIGKEMLPLYCLNRLGENVLSKIMACVNSHFPHITYSPLLPVATVMLLLYDDDPAQVFTHVCHLIFANARHCQYLDITEEDNAASAKVLRELSQRYASGSHKSLLNLTSTPDEVYGQWLRCLFQGLPFSFVVVLFDMYLLEGYKALYRISLAILRFYRKSGVSNAENIMETVFEFVRGIESKVQPAIFFKKAFNFKLPSSKEIFKLHRSIMFRYKSDFSMISKGTMERTPWNYLRVVKDLKSDIVDETLMSSIYCWVPESCTDLKPSLLFSTNRNGYFIHSFYSCVEEVSPILLLIKTTDGEVLGAFCSEPWDKRRTEVGYFGTGETFIFTVRPHTNIYRWVGLVNEVSNVEINAVLGESSSNGRVEQPVITSPSFTLPPIHQNGSSHTILTSQNNLVAETSEQDPFVLPPLVLSNHSLASHANSHASSGDSSACDSQLSNCLIGSDLNRGKSDTNLSAGGTFEEIPHLSEEVAVAGPSGQVETPVFGEEQISPSPSKEFSKENLPKLVEEGYKPSRRYSTLPEDSPLTSAIENIFDSSRKASFSSENQSQEEEEQPEVPIIVQAVSSIVEKLEVEQENDNEGGKETQEEEVEPKNTESTSSPVTVSEESTVKAVQSSASIASTTPLVSARNNSDSPPVEDDTDSIPDFEPFQSIESVGVGGVEMINDGAAVSNPPTLCNSTSANLPPHIEITKSSESIKPPTASQVTNKPPPRNDLFMMANENGFMIGGGGGGYGIFIDSALNSGTTEYCSTFRNNPLVKGGKFKCSVIEVFSFGTNNC